MILKFNSIFFCASQDIFWYLSFLSLLLGLCHNWFWFLSVYLAWYKRPGFLVMNHFHADLSSMNFFIELTYTNVCGKKNWHWLEAWIDTAELSFFAWLKWRVTAVFFDFWNPMWGALGRDTWQPNKPHKKWY